MLALSLGLYLFWKMQWSLDCFILVQYSFCFRRDCATVFLKHGNRNDYQRGYKNSTTTKLKVDHSDTAINIAQFY